MKLHSILNIFLFLSLFFSCKKSTDAPKPSPAPVDSTEVIQPQVDPVVASTIGFFMNDWMGKQFDIPTSYTTVSVPGVTNNTITIDRSNVITKISPSIAGNNANSWMGSIITEPNLIRYISDLHPHIIRFPGGSISDVYFWNAEKNVPPADAPSQLLNADGTSANAGYWYGKNNDSWTISLDKYYAMLDQTGNKGIITVNYGYARYGMGANPVSAAAHLAAEWVRYDNGRTLYWEVGNECFGEWEAGYRIKPSDNKDGQSEYASGELYGKHFKVFADSMRKAAQNIGKTIYIGAVMYDSAPAAWNTNTIKNWNNGLLVNAKDIPDFYVVHDYYTPYQTDATTDVILNTPKNITKTMMDFLKQTLANAGATIKPIIMDEWNITSQGSMQQVSNINGLHATMVLGEAIKNQFGMTARWDLANGWANGNDHGMFNIGDEPNVPKWNPRPAFYYMYFLQKYLGDRLVAVTSTADDLIPYASSYSSGETAVAIINKSAEIKSATIKINNFKTGNRFYWYQLKGGDDNGAFSRKVFVNESGPQYVSGGPDNYKTIVPYSAQTTNGIKLSIPGRAAVFVVVENK